MYVCWLCVDCWKLLLVLLVLYHEGANRNVQRTQKTLHVSFLRFLRWSYMFPNQTWLRLDRNAWSADDIQRCKTGALMMSHGCVEIPCRLLAVFAIFAYRKLSLFSDISPKPENCWYAKERNDLICFFLRAIQKLISLLPAGVWLHFRNLSKTWGLAKVEKMTWCNSIRSIPVPKGH